MSAPQSSPAPTDAEHNVTIEGDVESHLHPTPSWQVADHPMPTGHEEIWRFTPIAKFATVLAEQTTTACLDWTIDAPESVQVDELDPARLHDLAETPQDRISMMAAANSTHAPRHIVVPDDVELDSPVEITLTGTGVEEAA
ncbi:MAG: Fe-S cluster assembly protein SufD, partial [Cutibacterium granulosum]|nr:Fe-S cluster assembly protein SufD [Cutibacterium granulosum]